MRYSIRRKQWQRSEGGRNCDEGREMIRDDERWVVTQFGEWI